MSSPNVLIFVLFLFGLGHALPWAGAAETEPHARRDNPPAPTAEPVVAARLFKRDFFDASVCGWVGGKSVSPVVCPSDQVCIRDSANSHVGCCPASGSTCANGYYTTCTDADMAAYQNFAGMAGNGILSCTGTQRCYQNTYADGYHQYGCGATDQGVSIETTFSGEESYQLFLAPITTSISFNPGAQAINSASSANPALLGPLILSTPLSVPSTAATLTTTSLTSSPASSTSQTSSVSTSATASPESTPGYNTDGKEKTRRAEIIAAIVVGSSAALAGLVALILWCCQKRRDNKPAPSALEKSRISRPFVSEAQGPFWRLPDDAKESHGEFMMSMDKLSKPSAALPLKGSSSEFSSSKTTLLGSEHSFPSDSRFRESNIADFSSQWDAAIGAASNKSTGDANIESHASPPSPPPYSPDTPLAQRFDRSSSLPLERNDPADLGPEHAGIFRSSIVSAVSPESTIGLTIGLAHTTSQRKTHWGSMDEIQSGVEDAWEKEAQARTQEHTEVAETEAETEAEAEAKAQAGISIIGDSGIGGWSPQSLVMSPQGFGAGTEAMGDDVPILSHDEGLEREDSGKKSVKRWTSLRD